MDIKALFFDIDGTLLNSKRAMSQKTYHALEYCNDQGFLLGIATARPKRLVFHSNDQIPGKISFLTKIGAFYNGGVVFDQNAGLYRHNPIDGQNVKMIVDFVDSYDDTMQVVLQHEDDYHSFKQEISDAVLFSWGFARDELMPFNQANTRDTTKMMVFSGGGLPKRDKDFTVLYRELVQRFDDFANITLADSGLCIYIVAKASSKGNAIRSIIENYGIQPEEVAVFGDDTPDIGMFGQFGCSVAMGNANDTLKRMATHITISNEQDGIVYALETLLKII